MLQFLDFSARYSRSLEDFEHFARDPANSHLELPQLNRTVGIDGSLGF
ncbi:hypothetical protein WKK05_34940 [Nostoc sp. UHCC 0302]